MSESVESENCIKVLIEWIKTTKHTVYNKNIKNATNDENVLSLFSSELESFGNTIINAINNENIELLKENGWPDELMECIKNLNIRVDIIDNIENWFKTYPFNMSEFHNRELQKENAGLE